MSRFHRHSRISPRQLYRRQLVRAWCCLLLLLPVGLLVALPLLLQQLPHWGSREHTPVLNGVPYQAADTAAVTAKPASAAPAVRPPSPPNHQPPTPPILLCTDTGDLPKAENIAEFRLIDPTEETPDTDTEAAEALAALSAPAQPERKTPPPVSPAAATVPTPHSGASSAIAAAAQTPPAYRSNPRPPYPAAMRQRRLTGSVGVRIHISAEGTPTAVDITTPSGHSDFDRTTQSWILQHWRFRPATTNGTPIASSVKTRVDFTLER